MRYERYDLRAMMMMMMIDVDKNVMSFSQWIQRANQPPAPRMQLVQKKTIQTPNIKSRK